MKRNFETVLGEQCAPTLAGLKPASLFRWQGTQPDLRSRTEFQAAPPDLQGVQPGLQEAQRNLRGTAPDLIDKWSRVLAAYGIGLRRMKNCPGGNGCLLYLYRGRWLCRLLSTPENLSFLRRYGYDITHGCGGLLRQLERRLCTQEQFPHEIGIFLGYPLEDVEGFIANAGQNYTCLGCWKAYGDPDAAQERFQRYHSCTEIYRRNLQRGIPLTRLIIAA